MTTLADGTDVHPLKLVTVNVYEAGVRPDIVVDTPVPEYVFPPGERVIVQPAAGSPLKVTLPVATVHEG